MVDILVDIDEQNQIIPHQHSLHHHFSSLFPTHDHEKSDSLLQQITKYTVHWSREQVSFLVFFAMSIVATDVSLIHFLAVIDDSLLAFLSFLLHPLSRWSLSFHWNHPHPHPLRPNVSKLELIMISNEQFRYVHVTVIPCRLPRYLL